MEKIIFALGEEITKTLDREFTMQWIILIGDETFDLNTIKAVKHRGSVASYDVTDIKGRYCVDFGEDHIFYDINDIIEGYEEDELISVPYENPNFITMIYTSKDCIRNILKQGDFPNNIYIDNDFGLIVPIKEFIELGMPLDEHDLQQSMKRIELEKLRKYNTETDLIKIIQEIDDRINFRGYTKEQILCLVNEIVKINLLSVQYETREEILHSLCNALSYYDISGSVDLTSIIKIKDELEDDLKEYIEEFIDNTKKNIL